MSTPNKPVSGDALRLFVAHIEQLDTAEAEKNAAYTASGAKLKEAEAAHSALYFALEDARTIGCAARAAMRLVLAGKAYIQPDDDDGDFSVVAPDAMGGKDVYEVTGRGGKICNPDLLWVK